MYTSILLILLWLFVVFIMELMFKPITAREQVLLLWVSQCMCSVCTKPVTGQNLQVLNEVIVLFGIRCLFIPLASRTDSLACRSWKARLEMGGNISACSLFERPLAWRKWWLNTYNTIAFAIALLVHSYEASHAIHLANTAVDFWLQPIIFYGFVLMSFFCVIPNSTWSWLIKLVA